MGLEKKIQDEFRGNILNSISAEYGRVVCIDYKPIQEKKLVRILNSAGINVRKTCYDSPIKELGKVDENAEYTAVMLRSGRGSGSDFVAKIHIRPDDEDSIKEILESKGIMIKSRRYMG